MIKDALIFVFGKNAEIRFHRIALMLAGVVVFLLLFFNVTIKTKYFEWRPAGKVDVDVNLKK